MHIAEFEDWERRRDAVEEEEWLKKTKSGCRGRQGNHRKIYFCVDKKSQYSFPQFSD